MQARAWGEGRCLRSLTSGARPALWNARYPWGRAGAVRVRGVSGGAVARFKGVMPLRLPPAQPSPGSHQSRLLPKTHPACIAQVCLAGSMTIDEEVTDYFKDTGWGALVRCSLRLKSVQPSNHAPPLPMRRAGLARHVANPPSLLAPSCRNRAAVLLKVHHGRLSAAAAMLLTVPFPNNVVLRCTLSWRPTGCWRGAGGGSDGGRGADLRTLGALLPLPMLN